MAPGDIAGKKKKEKAKAVLEKIIKNADGVAPTLMMRGNYGRLILKKTIAEKLANAMPSQVNCFIPVLQDIHYSNYNAL